VNDPLIIAAQRALERARAEIHKPTLAQIFAPDRFMDLMKLDGRAADLHHVLKAYETAPRALCNALAPAMQQAIRSLQRAVEASE